MPTIHRTVTKTIEVQEEREVERIPMLLPSLRDVTALEKSVVQYVESREKEDYIDEDLQRHVFETALEFFYGKGIWDYLHQFLCP